MLCCSLFLALLITGGFVSNVPMILMRHQDVNSSPGSFPRGWSPLKKAKAP
jgi:hypothetical protein